MLSISPYINLDGKCAEAVAFYERVFEATNLGVMRFGDMPGSEQPVPEHLKDRVLHAAIEIDGNKIMFSDTMPGSSFRVGDELTIAITSSELGRLKQIYAELSEEGEVQMEQQETFFSPLYAIVRDKYGITWQLMGEKE